MVLVDSVVGNGVGDSVVGCDLDVLNVVVVDSVS